MAKEALFNQAREAVLRSQFVDVRLPGVLLSSERSPEGWAWHDETDTVMPHGAVEIWGDGTILVLSWAATSEEVLPVFVDEAWWNFMLFRVETPSLRVSSAWAEPLLEIVGAARPGVVPEGVALTVYTMQQVKDEHGVPLASAFLSRALQEDYEGMAQVGDMRFLPVTGRWSRDWAKGEIWMKYAGVVAEELFTINNRTLAPAAEIVRTPGFLVSVDRRLPVALGQKVLLRCSRCDGQFSQPLRPAMAWNGRFVWAVDLPKKGAPWWLEVGEEKAPLGKGMYLFLA